MEELNCWYVVSMLVIMIESHPSILRLCPAPDIEFALHANLCRGSFFAHNRRTQKDIDLPGSSFITQSMSLVLESGTPQPITPN